MGKGVEGWAGEAGGEGGDAVGGMRKGGYFLVCFCEMG